MKIYGYMTKENIDMARKDVPELSDEEFSESVENLVRAGYLTWNGTVYLMTTPDHMEE